MSYIMNRLSTILLGQRRNFFGCGSNNNRRYREITRGNGKSLQSVKNDQSCIYGASHIEYDHYYVTEEIYEYLRTTNAQITKKLDDLYARLDKMK